MAKAADSPTITKNLLLTRQLKKLKNKEGEAIRTANLSSQSNTAFMEPNVHSDMSIVTSTKSIDTTTLASSFSKNACIQLKLAPETFWMLAMPELENYLFSNTFMLWALCRINIQRIKWALQSILRETRTNQWRIQLVLLMNQRTNSIQKTSLTSLSI